MREVDKRLGALFQVLRDTFLGEGKGRDAESYYCLGPLGPLYLCSRGLHDMSWWEPQGLLDPSAQGDDTNEKGRPSSSF